MPSLKTRSSETTPPSCPCADLLAQMWTRTLWTCLRDAPSNQKTRTRHCSLGGVSGDFSPRWFIWRLSNEAQLAKGGTNAKGEYRDMWLAIGGWFWENAVVRNVCDQPKLISQFRILTLCLRKYDVLVNLKVGTFKKRDEQVSRSWRNCVLHLFHGLRKLRMNRERSLLGAGCAPSLINIDKCTLQSQLRIMHFAIIWWESLNFTTTRMCFVFCKRCVETDSLEVACLESFVPVCDRKRALWQITDASFRAHVAWSLFDLVPRCVCLLWWLASVRLTVVKVGGPAGVQTWLINLV